MNTRNASFSKTIEIPITDNNRNLLKDQMVEFGAYNGKPYTYITCQIISRGVSILTDGRIFISSESETGKTLTINIFGGTVDFFSSLSDNLIGELDWSEFNFDWNLTNIATYVNTTEGFLFAQSSWFNNSDWEKAESQDISDEIELNDPDIRVNGGWMYFKTIIDKIVSLQPNLLFDFSNLNNVSIYNEMALCIPVTKLFDNFSEIEGFSGLVEESGSTVSLPGGFFEPPVRAVFPTVQEDEPIGFWDVSENAFIITNESSYNIKLNIDLTAFGTATIFGYGSVGVIRERGGVLTSLGGQSIRSKIPQIVVVETTRSFLVGDKVYVDFGGQGSDNTTGFNWSGTFNVNGSSAAKNDFVNLGEWMPKISQKNFIKEVFKFFHAIPYYEDGIIKIELWDNIPEGLEIDLTPYVDTGKSIDVSGQFTSYAQKNKFQYTPNDTVFRLGTDFDFSMLNDSLPENKTVIQSLFSASDQSASSGYNFGSFPLMPFSFSHITDNLIFVTAGSTSYTTPNSNGLEVGDLIFVRNSLNTGYQERKRVVQINSDTTGIVDVAFVGTSAFNWDLIRNTKQEIGLRFGRVESDTNVTVRDGGTSILASNMKKVVFNESLTWSGLVDSFYGNLVDTLTKPTVKRLWLNLPISIYNSLTLLNPAYIGNKRWYINKIEQYNPTKLCRVELLELKQPLPLSQVTSYSVSFQFLDLGTVNQGQIVTDNITILNNGGSIEVVDITRQGGTGIGAWSLSSAQVTLNPTLSEVVVLTYQSDTVTVGIQTVDIKCLDQFGKEIITTVQVNVVE